MLGVHISKLIHLEIGKPVMCLNWEMFATDITITLHGHYGVSNHHKHDCFFNCLFRLTIKKTSPHYSPFVRRIHRWPNYGCDSRTVLFDVSQDSNIFYSINVFFIFPLIFSDELYLYTCVPYRICCICFHYWNVTIDFLIRHHHFWNIATLNCMYVSWCLSSFAK